MEAAEDKFLTRLRNCVTGQVPADIRTLLLVSFQVYGKITAKKLREKYDEVATMAYNISKPVDVIFSAVEDLRKIVELASRPYTDLQIVDLGHIVIGNHNMT